MRRPRLSGGWYWGLLGLGAAVLVAIAVWAPLEAACHVPGRRLVMKQTGSTGCIEFWLYRYQTFISAIAAAVAAFFVWRQLRATEQQVVQGQVQLIAFRIYRLRDQVRRLEQVKKSFDAVLISLQRLGNPSVTNGIIKSQFVVNLKNECDDVKRACEAAFQSLAQSTDAVDDLDEIVAQLDAVERMVQNLINVLATPEVFPSLVAKFRNAIRAELDNFEQLLSQAGETRRVEIAKQQKMLRKS